MKYDANYYVNTAMHFVKQFPDLEFKDFKKMLRKKSGKGLTCDFEEKYKEYLNYRENISKTLPVPEENS